MEEPISKAKVLSILMDIGVVQMAIGLFAMIYFLFFDPADILIGLFMFGLGFSVFAGGANFGFFKGE